jgi:hypothetical protein
VDARLDGAGGLQAVSFITSDIADFITATKGLRSGQGSPVTFLVPQEPTWPPGTAINPDTNTPYDAMVKRTNAEYDEVVKTCGVILKQASPLRPQSDIRVEPAGIMEAQDIILDVDSDDYPDIAEASDFMVNGQTYTVEERKPFSIGGQLYRYLIYGAEH